MDSKTFITKLESLFIEQWEKGTGHFLCRAKKANPNIIKIAKKLKVPEIRVAVHMYIMNKVPRCLCGKPKTFHVGRWYGDYCSRECSKSEKALKIRTKKIKKTTRKRYGVDNVLSLPEVRNKMKKTMLKRLGVEHSTQSPRTLAKMRKTNLARRGVPYSWNDPTVKAKTKKTVLEKYGVSHYSKTKEFKNKIIATNMERFGFKSPAQNEKIKAKIRKTNRKRYGVDHVFQTNYFQTVSRANSFKWNSIELDGKHFFYQGYEKFLLKDLVSKYGANKVHTDPDQMPEFWYEQNGIHKRYFPDIRVGKDIYEVKSPYTLLNEFEMNREKAKSVRNTEYNYKCLVYEGTGKLLMTIGLTKNKGFYEKALVNCGR